MIDIRTCDYAEAEARMLSFASYMESSVTCPSCGRVHKFDLYTYFQYKRVLCPCTRTSSGEGSTVIPLTWEDVPQYVHENIGRKRT